MTARPFALVALSLLLACGDKDDGGGPPGPQDDTGGGDGGADGGAGGDGGNQVPSNETDCEDGRDEDQDGAADCEDSDCASHWRCALPEQMDFRSDVFFDGYTIECEAWGIEVDVDIEDCVADAVSALRLVTTGRLCESCERTYEGTLTYNQDTCSALLETVPPTRAEYGFNFLDANTRELWSPDEMGTWQMVDRLVSTDGVTWTLAGTEEIWADPEDCDNGNQNLGLLSVTLTWRDR
ncbi:hypothetical protein L6R53_26265 [Myxococcota bacterium]|nr:hypothetical protein [Myxococcota bacterium]